MSIQTDKCLAFQVVHKNKSWHIIDPHLKLNNTAIPLTGLEDTIRYLGVNISPWRGSKHVNINKITDAVTNILKMKLKPYQKVNLIRTHLLPKYIHEMVSSPPPLQTLEMLDTEIKQKIKEALQLHPATTDCLIYTEKGNGGLGVQKLKDIVRIATLRSGIRMLRSEDQAVREAYKGQEAMILKYANSLGIEWPASDKEIEGKRASLCQGHADRWEALSSQGRGVRCFKYDKYGNAWLQRPTLLKPSRYIDALRLRTNTYGIKIALKRANNEIDPICRKCRGQIETLGHIHGNCIFAKNARIRRLNDIVNYIEKRVSKKMAVFKEPSINVIGDLKKSDLVINDQERLRVADVTVRYEDIDGFKKAYIEKMEKYKDTARYLRARLNIQRYEVLPVVIGSRGAIPLSTLKNLKALGLGAKDIIVISLIALRSSIEIANEFMDYDYIL